MGAQILQFPARANIAWHHVAPAVHSVALARSGSEVVAARVVEVVKGAYERCVPASITFRSDSVASMLEDVSEIFHQIIGTMAAEMTQIATDAEMLSVDQGGDKQ